MKKSFLRFILPRQLFCASLAVALCVGGFGCATTGNVQSYLTPANARIATALVCSNTLTFAVHDSDRAQIAAYVYSIAHGVRTLAGGHVPSPAELQSTIEMFAPSAGKYATLGTSIGAIYGGVFSQIKGNPKLALDYLEAIASGCEDAAAPFLAPSPTPSP